MEYLNCLIASRFAEQYKHSRENKIINIKEHIVEHICYFCRHNLRNNQWKSTKILLFTLYNLIEELDDLVEAEVARENMMLSYPAQKIKIIKA